MIQMIYALVICKPNPDTHVLRKSCTEPFILHNFYSDPIVRIQR